MMAARKKRHPAGRRAVPVFRAGSLLPMLVMTAAAGVLVAAGAAYGPLSRIAVSAAMVSAKLAVPRGGATMLAEHLEQAVQAFAPQSGEPASGSASSGVPSGASSGASSAAPVSSAPVPAASGASGTGSAAK